MQVDSYSVLLVEDDSGSTDLAHRAVAESCPEINLINVAGCDAMLDWLSGGITKNEQMPHIIVMDLKLPKLDGLAVLRKLRMHTVTRDIPIVVFSAQYTQADVQMSYRAGANSFVVKPIDLAQFTDFFLDQLAYWMQPRRRVAGRN
jgi:two-component system, response regulator